MRCFRIKRRNIKNKKVENQRDYIGIEKLIKFGYDTYDRYDARLRINNPTCAELYEKISGKWVLIPEKAAIKLFESDILETKIVSTENKIYWYCTRCDINTLDNSDRMCPCPRGGCEAEKGGEITIVTSVKFFEK